MSDKKLSWYDLEELAAEVSGLDPEQDIDFSTIEQALCDKYEISSEAFEDIIQQLFGLLQFGISPLTSKPYVGFAKGNGWLLKKEIPTSFFISSLIEWITNGDEPEKGFIKPITSNGIREYDLILVKSEYEVSIKKQQS